MRSSESIEGKGNLVAKSGTKVALITFTHRTRLELPDVMTGHEVFISSLKIITS